MTNFKLKVIIAYVLGILTSSVSAYLISNVDLSICVLYTVIAIIALAVSFGISRIATEHPTEKAGSSIMFDPVEDAAMGKGADDDNFDVDAFLSKLK